LRSSPSASRSAHRHPRPGRTFERRPSPDRRRGRSSGGGATTRSSARCRRGARCWMSPSITPTPADPRSSSRCPASGTRCRTTSTRVWRWRTPEGPAVRVSGCRCWGVSSRTMRDSPTTGSGSIRAASVRVSRRSRACLGTSMATVRRTCPRRSASRRSGSPAPSATRTHARRTRPSCFPTCPRSTPSGTWTRSARRSGWSRSTTSASSYGTYLGQVYATLFPDRIRRAVFDSTVDPRNVWYQANLDQDVAFDRQHPHLVRVARRVPGGVPPREDREGGGPTLLRRADRARGGTRRWRGRPRRMGRCVPARGVLPVPVEVPRPRLLRMGQRPCVGS